MWSRLRRFLRTIGPGVVTGAADDDPSGIATYSQTGAQFGYGLLWTVIVTLPMMVAIQEISARIGIVNGKGIAGVVKEHYPRPLLLLVVALISVANTINLGADLGAMAAATRLLVPIPFLVLTLIFAVISMALEILVSYRHYSRILKWLTLFLLAYVLTGLIVSHDWAKVLSATFIPHIRPSLDYLLILVAVLGTTISPYMFFWQASQEVEEEIERGDVCREKGIPASKCLTRPVVVKSDIRGMRIDTWSGMLFSQLGMWFIIITAAGTLHEAGITDVKSAADAALALEPLVHTFPYSGTLAKVLFSLGIIGLGLIAVPVFAASASYAIAELYGWSEGLSRSLRDAPCFYGVVVAATGIGLTINFLGINPIKALIYAAVINGLAAVPLIYIILRIGSDRRIMGRHITKGWIRVAGWITFAVMGLSAVAMILAWAKAA